VRSLKKKRGLEGKRDGALRSKGNPKKKRGLDTTITVKDKELKTKGVIKSTGGGGSK